MYVLRITLLLSYFGCILCSRCASMDDCIMCVSKRSWVPFINVNCRWCPLTKSCHAAGALFLNNCPAVHSVTKTARCYEPETGVYDPENACIYTLLSAVSYSDHPQQCLEQLLPRGRFQVKKVIGKKCEFLPFTYKECYAILAVSDDSKLIVVAYRGTTNSKQLTDEIISTVWPKTSFKSGGEVQRYFNNAFQQLYDCAKDTLKELYESNPNYDVIITGHSLGGAMASLTAVSLVYDKVIPADRLTLYTFGMPRVGDKRYALAFDRLVGNSWRVVHYQDIVPRIPSRVAPLYGGQPYHHKTEIYYPREEMLPNSDYTICRINEDRSCANIYIIHPIDGVGYHTNYFGIRVGTQCSNISARRRRSVDGNEISAMSHLFSNKTCTVLDISDIVSSSHSAATQYGHQLMVPSLVLGLSYTYMRY